MCLGFWSGCFSFSPFSQNTLPFFLFLVFSLCVIPIHSCQQHHSHTDWTGWHGHKVSQHIEPLPFFPIHITTFPSFAFLCPSICPLNTPSLSLLHHVVCGKALDANAIFGFTNTQHTLEWMEWVTAFALLCHNTQSPSCLFLNKHKPPHKPQKHYCCITH